MQVHFKASKNKNKNFKILSKIDIFCKNLLPVDSSLQNSTAEVMLYLMQVYGLYSFHAGNIVLTYLAGTDLFVVVLAFILGIWAIFAARKAQDEMHTGYSLSEALILELIDPKYDGRFYIELTSYAC